MADPMEKTGDTEARDSTATDILEKEGIDPEKLPDMTDPDQWRDAKKEGGGA